MTRTVNSLTTPCACADPGCPGHPAISICPRRATQTLRRIDMDDRTGTPMCDTCAADACESGLSAHCD